MLHASIAVVLCYSSELILNIQLLRLPLSRWYDVYHFVFGENLFSLPFRPWLTSAWSQSRVTSSSMIFLLTVWRALCSENKWPLHGLVSVLRASTSIWLRNLLRKNFHLYGLTDSHEVTKFEKAPYALDTASVVPSFKMHLCQNEGIGKKIVTQRADLLEFHDFFYIFIFLHLYV